MKVTRKGTESQKAERVESAEDLKILEGGGGFIKETR